MNSNNIYKRLLQILNIERENFKILIDADSILGLNVLEEDIINYLEFASNDNAIKAPIVGNIIITEGDIISILKIIHDITHYEGVFTLYINYDNMGTIAYLINRANKIYQELNLNVKIEINFAENYNQYLNELVTIIGSEKFVNIAGIDFPNANKVAV